ncbi:hypothetical protein HanPSC8_Chr11g0475051 [Helianthus annuus]|nr:hypothetical protein HanPSC8_Chr11g0475051 [Helianthus annuus]
MVRDRKGGSSWRWCWPIRFWLHLIWWKEANRLKRISSEASGSLSSIYTLLYVKVTFRLAILIEEVFKILL